MTRKRDKPPAPMVRKTSRGLSPAGAYDEEILDDFPIGQEFDLVPLNGDVRPKLQRKYFAILGAIVKATDLGPTKEKLHEGIKLDLGFVERMRAPSGKIFEVPDSVAFVEMTDDQFQVFYESAIRYLSECLGFDPLELLPKREGA